MSKYFYIVLSIIMLGCSSTRVVYDKNVNFDVYESFNCLVCEDDYSKENADLDNPTLRSFIREEIITILQENDLTYQTENPQLLVDFRIVVEEHTAVLGNPQTMYDYWETYKYPTGKFRKRILLVNLIDANNQKAIWQGMTTNLVDSDLNKMNEKTRKSLVKMFKNF